MSDIRPFALFRTKDQWLRARHEETFLQDDGVVTLGWTDPQRVDTLLPSPVLGGGLAFDGECRLYHSDPEKGRLERLLWARGPGDLARPDQDSIDLVAAPPSSVVGDFEPSADATAPLREPRGIAVDVDDRLFVAETGARRILIFDLFARRLLRRVEIPAPGGGRAAPIDLACRGHTVWVLTADPPGLLRLEARRDPVAVELPPTTPSMLDAVPRRVAVSADGEIAVLYRAAGESAWVVWPAEPHRPPLEVPGGSDLEFLNESDLVVARQQEADFIRFTQGLRETPLKARGYDGFGIVRTPDGRIGFWTAEGFRHAVPARIEFVPVGRVSTYRLDSGEFQSQWGRLFLDACIPPGTDVRVAVATADESGDEPSLPRTPPGNVVAGDVRRPDLSPPTVPVSLAPSAGALRPLHRRETGREVPWARPASDDPFETYEAPVDAPPGRYLWVTLELRGTVRLTPKVRAIRAEHPSHDLLRRLPNIYSRDVAVASFLRRYLAMFDGTLGEMGSRAADRGALIDPRSTPDEALAWLASFVGLVLDERWPTPSRRKLIEEVIDLWRFRGTLAGLRRFIEIYLEIPVVIVEQFRLRGSGNATLSAPTSAPVSRSILGAGFRVGGLVGTPGDAPVSGDSADAFSANAHRFSVIVPSVLSGEQADVVRHVLDVHRPAHTVVDLCSVGAGIRVGRGLHIGLSSLIGRSGGWDEARVGDTALGRGSVLGRAAPGTRIGLSSVGDDSRVG